MHFKIYYKIVKFYFGYCLCIVSSRKYLFIYEEQCGTMELFNVFNISLFEKDNSTI